MASTPLLSALELALSLNSEARPEVSCVRGLGAQAAVGWFGPQLQSLLGCVTLGTPSFLQKASLLLRQGDDPELVSRVGEQVLHTERGHVRSTQHRAWGGAAASGWTTS